MNDYDYLTAIRILQGTGLDIVDAARIAVEATELCGRGINRIRRGLNLASHEIKNKNVSIPFSNALEECIKAKSHRRHRTLSDIRQLMNKLQKANPKWSARLLRSLTSTDCRLALERAFKTPRQFYKARLALSGIFAYGKKRGWCSSNPIEQIDVPVLREKEVRALSLDEINALLGCSQSLYKGSCAPIIGLMVYAGIRPNEAERLTWKDIDLEEKIISLRPTHTKTGGTRHVSILPVLDQWLKTCLEQYSPDPGLPICPKNWRRKWKQLRIKAGWDPAKGKKWQQDCLRHTFASYHAKHFRDYKLLQMEMGHRSSSLLRTRYLNMSGIRKHEAHMFWKPSVFHTPLSQLTFT